MKSLKKLLLLITALLLFAISQTVSVTFNFPPGISAQDDATTELQCRLDELQAAAASASERLNDLQNAATEQEAIAILAEVRQSLAYEHCYGLRFEDHAEKVYGPLTLPAGYWKVTAQTDGFLIFRAEVISGNCRTESIMSLSSAREPGRSSEALYRADEGECLIIFTASNVTAPYRVTFEKLD